VLLDDLLYQGQGFQPVNPYATLACLALQNIQHVHVQWRRLPGQHSKKVRPNLAEKMSSKTCHFDLSLLATRRASRLCVGHLRRFVQRRMSNSTAVDNSGFYQPAYRTEPRHKRISTETQTAPTNLIVERAAKSYRASQGQSKSPKLRRHSAAVAKVWMVGLEQNQPLGRRGRGVAELRLL
jgi:hypothetical protein